MAGLAGLAVGGQSGGNSQAKNFDDFLKSPEFFFLRSPADDATAAAAADVVFLFCAVSRKQLENRERTATGLVKKLLLGAPAPKLMLSKLFFHSQLA